MESPEEESATIEEMIADYNIPRVLTVEPDSSAGTLLPGILTLVAIITATLF